MKTKRFLSILLSLVLVLGMLPGMSLTAYAEDGKTPITSPATTGTMTITLTIKTMTVSAEDVTATVDGQPHGITVNVTDPATGYTIKYGTVEGTYNQTTSPTQTEVGSKTVYYQVTAANYATYTGSATVTVSAKQTQTITASDVTATYGDTGVKINASVTTGGGALSYAVKSGDAVTMNETTGALTIVKAGSAVITVTAAENDTYAKATKDVNVTVNTKAMTVSAEDVNATVDGQPHGITVTVIDPASGATVKYGTEAGSYTLDASPTQTEVGEKTVYYQVTADNYTTYTGSAKVTVSAKQTQTITAEDVTATYGDTDKSVSATVTVPETGGGAISYAVKTGSENYIDVNLSTGALTIKKVPADGKAYVTVTAAETTTGGTGGNGYAATTLDVTVNISKADNPLTYAATQTVSKTCSTSAQTETLAEASNGQGDVSYAIQSQKDSADADVNYFNLNGTALTLAANTPAGTYTVVVRASAAGNDNYKSGALDSTVTVTVNGISQDAPVATGFTVTDATNATSADGVISGVTSAMEYSLDGTTWTAVTGTTITGLNPGDVQIRYAADATHSASSAVTVTVGNQALTAANAVSDTITALPAAADITLDNAQAVADAKAAYDALTADQKALVPEETVNNLNAAVAKIADLTAANTVSNTISALPAAANVTTANKDAIEAARAAYNALTADQKEMVSADTLKKLTDAEDALAAAQKDADDTEAANAVTDTINDLPAADAVTLSDGPDIQAARNAYNALTADQKAKVSAATLKKLTDAETALAAVQAAADQEAADTAAAEAVTDKISALPASTEVTTADKAAIEAARAAYNALTDYQKTKVSADTLKKLTDAETALAEAQAASDKETADTAAAQAVTDSITALPAANEVTIADKAAIEAARAAYDALTADQKAKVSAATLKNLTDAEAALATAQAAADQEAADTAAAQAVTDKISALPDADKVQATDKAAIEAARAAYDALTEVQKGKITKAAVKKLTDCEAALQALTAHGTYNVINGEGGSYTKDSSGTLTFTFKRETGDETTYDHFRGAEMDGRTMERDKHYTAAKGSLILTLKADFLDTLAVGSHTLRVLFEDGKAESHFTVSKAIDPTKFEDVAVESDSFTFKVVWKGGSDKNIDFTLYKKDGTVYRHGFDKKKLGSGEWQYSAWFSAPEACYVIETPMAGYQILYENVGVYAQVTDRCCDGGTITIHKVPKTGDTANLALWMSMVVIGAMTLCGVAVISKRRKHSEK